MLYYRREERDRSRGELIACLRSWYIDRNLSQGPLFSFPHLTLYSEISWKSVPTRNTTLSTYSEPPPCEEGR